MQGKDVQFLSVMVSYFTKLAYSFIADIHMLLLNLSSFRFRRNSHHTFH